MPHWRFLFRQIAACKKQSAIFILCVALALLTLVSTGALRSSVRTSMLSDARQLHAADIIINSHHPLSFSLRRAIDRLEKSGTVQGCAVYQFYSMARNPATDKLELVDLKVTGRGYPFYGKVELASGRKFSEVLQPGSIVVEQEVLAKLKAKVGDKLQIGSTALPIAG